MGDIRFHALDYKGDVFEEIGVRKGASAGRLTVISSIAFVFVLAGLTNTSAFGFLGFGSTASWKEEVLLHDGSKIIVKRWQKHGGDHEIGQEPGIAEQSITFALPGTKKTIQWKDEYSPEVGGCNFILIALHILNTTPYLITNPRLDRSYNKWGRPNPPYVIFKFEGNDWKRITISELPMQFKNVNLVNNTLQHEDNLVRKRLAPTEMVIKLNSSLKQAEYKTILRAPLENINVPTLVPTEDGGWIGIDWFTSQRSYEACMNFCKKEKIKAGYCPCDAIFQGRK